MMLAQNTLAADDVLSRILIGAVHTLASDNQVQQAMHAVSTVVYFGSILEQYQWK